MGVTLRALPPEEAIESFRRKGYQIGFDWRDVWQEEHQRSFTVAKAMRTDLLQDIRAAVDEAIAEGTTLAQFRERLTPVLQERGWWGRQAMVDPLTGETVTAQLGSPRRLEIIFDTNLRQSYAVGRWERIERNAADFPFLRYVATLDERTRDDHRAWHGTILPVDDPWWDTHYPPNDWRCRCTVVPLTPEQAEALGGPSTEPPPSPTRAWRNPRTGEVIRAPQGVNPGFAYNPGRAAGRSLTPPPLPGAPATGTPPAGAGPLPPPRASTRQPLPDDLTEEQYVAAFLAEFGARPGQSVLFRDVVGEPLSIGEDLFRTATGRGRKLGRDVRGQYLPYLADTIRDPDEIWMTWQTLPDGRAVLRRRYVSRWLGTDGRVAGLAVFEEGRDGWRGVTAFPPKQGQDARRQDDYLDRWRIGTRVYRRGEG